MILIGLLADVISANRKLLEDLVYRVALAARLPGEHETPTPPPAAAAARAAAGPERRWER